MGWGDEIMASAQAKALHAADTRKVRILGVDKRPRWSDVWAFNPKIAKPWDAGDFQYVINGPGARPYILAKSPERWTWKAWHCEPGEICFSPAERSFARRFEPGVVIEAGVKAKASPNKAWGSQNWTRFVELALAAGVRLTQLGPIGTPLLPGVIGIETPDFRHACAILARARAYVGHEGGMHHAAAALGIPAVVIFGGYISPAQTGYAAHANLFTGGEPCGSRLPCKHCARAMAEISPERVFTELETKLATA